MNNTGLHTINANAYSFGFNGKEHDDNIYGKDNSYDYGMRFYDPRLGRWLSTEPLFKKYPYISPYIYSADSPIFYIDEDVNVIVIPNKGDRSAILKMINSRAAGLFGINAKGELYLTRKEGAKGFSTYYRDKLVKAIESSNKIDVSISQTYQNFDASQKKMIAQDVDKNAGGGVTLWNPDNKDVQSHIKDVNSIISGRENTELKDVNNKPLRDKPADILQHELVGHAIPLTTGNGKGNAVEDENKARAQENGGGQRKAEPSHKEDPTK